MRAHSSTPSHTLRSDRMHTNTHTQEPAAAADKKKPAAAGGRKRAAKEEDAAAPAAAAAEVKAAAAAPAAKKAKAGGGKLAAGDALPAFELETDGALSRCAACVVCRDGRGTSLCSVASHIIHQHLSRHLPFLPQYIQCTEGVVVKSSDLVADGGIVIFAYPR